MFNNDLLSFSYDDEYDENFVESDDDFDVYNDFENNADSSIDSLDDEIYNEIFDGMDDTEADVPTASDSDTGRVIKFDSGEEVFEDFAMEEAI